jgi:hypothetical protein
MPRRWQTLITNQLAPATINSRPVDAPYVTNLTRAATLVCDPHIQIVPQLVRDLGGIVDLSSVSAEYSAGIGNMDKEYMSYMIYNYAVQQALDVTGIFRPYIILGQLPGNAVLTSDPSNPVAGTVPRSTMEIGLTLVMSTFCNAFLTKPYCNITSGCIYRISK